MEITYLGHSSFKIKTKTAVVVTDPFDPDMVGLKFPPVDADIATVSHDHKDHNNVSKVNGARKVLTGPGEYEIMGVSILGFPSFHDAEKGEKRGKNTIYVFEAEGLRLAHLGDLGHVLDDSIIDQIGAIDVLFVPVGGEWTLNAKEATEVVGKIDPYFVIPMHYQVAGLNPETFAGLSPAESFLKESGLAVENLPKFLIKREDIGEDQSAKVVVLERK